MSDLGKWSCSDDESPEAAVGAEPSRLPRNEWTDPESERNTVAVAGTVRATVLTLIPERLRELEAVRIKTAVVELAHSPRFLACVDL